jgi:sec-independent protein translocase protein TatA
VFGLARAARQEYAEASSDHEDGNMFDIGGWEWVILLVIVLIIFGGSRLPGLFKALGQGVKEFRDASRDDAPAAAAGPEKPQSDSGETVASPSKPALDDKPSA